MNVRQRLYSVALERGLRETTVVSYERLLGRLSLLDLDVEQVTPEQVTEALWTIDSPNTRRAAVIAVRSVLGIPLRIPKGIPRRYDLPDETTLRLALMTCTYETRALLMAYGGLRLGEACAIEPGDLRGDRLRVARQVIEVWKDGAAQVRVGPTKTAEADVVIPGWLGERLGALEGTDKPSTVREAIRRAGTRVGLHLNPHQLRHWHATMLLERGVPLIVVSRQMRHSDIATTLRTYHQVDAAQAIHDALG